MSTLVPIAVKGLVRGVHRHSKFSGSVLILSASPGCRELGIISIVHMTNPNKPLWTCGMSFFDKWDESQLCLFQGIVAPKGPKAYLVLLAKAKYQSYKHAVGSFTSQASANAGTLTYGDTAHKSAWIMMATSVAQVTKARSVRSTILKITSIRLGMIAIFGEGHAKIERTEDERAAFEYDTMMKDLYAAVT